jgi:hypothetical protein
MEMNLINEYKDYTVSRFYKKPRTCLPVIQLRVVDGVRHSSRDIANM